MGIYIAKGDHQEGPFDRESIEARIRGGELKRDTLAWQKGMADWIPLKQMFPEAFLGPKSRWPERRLTPLIRRSVKKPAYAWSLGCLVAILTMICGGIGISILAALFGG